MNWTQLLEGEVESAYRATEGLLRLVDKDKLSWKPATGKDTRPDEPDKRREVPGPGDLLAKGDDTRPDEPDKRRAALIGHDGYLLSD